MPIRENTPLQRQWILLQLLARRRAGVTVREMAAEVHVTQRTIQRDLSTLCQVGFPLDERESKFGRKHWQLRQPGTESPLSFAWDEAISLYLGRRFLEPLAGTYLWDGAQRAFAKIRSVLGDPALRYLEKMASAFHHTTGGAGDYSQQAEIIDLLMQAVEDCRIAFITYQSMHSTEPATRDVYPYGIVYHQASLYLVAFAVEHNEIRHYKVDRIEDVQLEDLKFVRPEDFNLEQHLADSFGIYQASGRPIKVRIRFAPEAARIVEESNWHASQKLTHKSDGSLTAEFRLSHTNEIKSWILSFGKHAVVEQPASLRDEIIAEAHEIIAAYSAVEKTAQASRSDRGTATGDES